MKISKVLIHFLIGFIVSLVLLSYSISTFLKLPLEGNALLFTLGLSLFFGLIALAKHKGHTHFGHIPLILGMLGLIVGGGFLYGNIESEALGKSQWWNIEDVESKTVLFIIAVFGIIFTLIGLKGMLGNWFFLRPFGSGRR
jgi:hypothetical protein